MRLCRAGNFGLGVGDCELDVPQREFCIVGVRRRQRVPIAHHRDPQRIDDGGEPHRVHEPYRIGSVGKGDLDAADIKPRDGAMGVGFCRRRAQPVDGLRRGRERRPVGLQRCPHRADALRDGRQLAELPFDLIGQLADARDRLRRGIPVADVPGPDEFLDRAVGAEQRGAHLRHAGVSGGAGHEFVHGSADPLDLNHGEAAEKDEEAQNQREAAKYPRADTDPGHH